MLINDGRTNDTAHVDSNNKLLVSAVIDDVADHSVEFGKKFNINTGDITLTDASITSLLYIKNNEDSDLYITSFIYNLGNTTGGSGDVVVDIIRNPTTGTIIDTTPTNVDVGTGVSANMNFGSNESLTIDAYKGTTADNNFTDGATIVSSRLASPTGRTIVALGSVVIPKGSSVGVSYTPPTSNTSQIVQIAVSCYLKTTDVEAE